MRGTPWNETSIAKGKRESYVKKKGIFVKKIIKKAFVFWTKMILHQLIWINYSK